MSNRKRWRKKQNEIKKQLENNESPNSPKDNDSDVPQDSASHERRLDADNLENSGQEQGSEMVESEQEEKPEDILDGQTDNNTNDMVTHLQQDMEPTDEESLSISRRGSGTDEKTLDSSVLSEGNNTNMADKEVINEENNRSTDKESDLESDTK